MSVWQIIEYVIVFAICYFSFMVLKRRYVDGDTWVDALKEGGKHIGIGAAITLLNPLSMLIIGIIVLFIILNLGRAL